MKKLINKPDAVVSDMLRGMVSADDGLCLMPAHNVVLRADYQRLKDSVQVALISGGGAGHEPAHAGYVGPGMLTAAVAGPIFTSPSVDAVLAAIRLTTGPAGCLLIVKNYTGDRLNFGLAAAIARSEGLAVEMVLVDDDVALDTGASRAGARGIAGTVLVHKVAGAAAADGMELTELVTLLEGFIQNVGSMGVALSPCINPSAGEASFALGESEIEYGLGIHGEQGVSREEIAAAQTIAERLVERIVREKGLKNGDRVVLLANGLGGTPPLEIAIMLGSAITAARAHGLRVERALSGTLLTALEMAGISLSLARIDDRLIAMLDRQTRVSAWPDVTHPGAEPLLVKEPQAHDEDVAASLSPLSSAQQELLLQTVRATASALIDAEEHLTTLDREVGDGDLGISLARGARAVLTDIQKLNVRHPSATMKEISRILRRSLGGTSGPLYAAFTLAISTRLGETGDVPDFGEWAAAMEAGCEAISQLGGAQLGDSTMLDALIPAAKSLTASAQSGSGEAQALADALAAAEQGTRSTAELKPRVGRASYVGERAAGHVDPGAQAVTIWLRAIGQHFQ
ncbi:dihydroxyacetone kinase subunit DhaL [Altericroceibacterium endophyticum]|uniref:Dihydroxyacetone kinase subunit L n=1 Tax=Altericroceibacterium endophyticum TaxID=1808508 RepID=A0A6I4T654_9SPHN|nr:dihydroxyacetone kinase subunit DhaL [Altericroceibacterium endophyticum]MXO66674.1 dihydroxyacetone kinase subunit L [Altericroceibacterium endophyticum]